jgi:flagellar basal body-associated protein FliL
MGNSLNLSETLIIALGVLTVIFAVLVLYAISMVSKLSQVILEVKSGKNAEKNNVQNFTNNNATAHNPAKIFNDSDDEEDRLVVALAASIMASNEKPDSYFHISKLIRIK